MAPPIRGVVALRTRLLAPRHRPRASESEVAIGPMAGTSGLVSTSNHERLSFHLETWLSDPMSILSPDVGLLRSNGCLAELRLQIPMTGVRAPLAVSYTGYGRGPRLSGPRLAGHQLMARLRSPERQTFHFRSL
eukprot:11584114-Alexandrium_andersonii.AAC.1